MSSPSRPVRLLGALALTGVLALAAGCGSADPEPDPGPADTPTTSSPTTGSSPTTPATPDATAVEITFAGGDVTPSGKKVRLAPGEALLLRISAEEAGELHVHSSPEQEIAFPKGDSEHTVTVDRPGLVEVESHHPAKLVLLLEVR